MKKKVVLIVIFMFLMSAMAFAAPLTGYEAGKASIDLNFRNSKNTIIEEDEDGAPGYTYKGKYNIEPSVTIGIADKWAIQYRNTNAKAKNTRFDWDSGYMTGDSKISVNEINVLYSLTKNASAFVGYVRTKGTETSSGIDNGMGFSGTTIGRKNTWQVGLLGVAPIAEKTSVYGIIGAGNKYTNLEIGVSYAFTKNLEFNLDYRYTNAKDLYDSKPGHDYSIGGKTKGPGFGLTCKFN